jgi:hypothetical protein
VVKPQNARGDLSNAGLRLDHGSLQSEVLSPSVYPWIKEPDEFTGPQQDRPDVTAFLAVAEDTGIRQIVRFRWAAMLHTDNVIDFAPIECLLFVY